MGAGGSGVGSGVGSGAGGSGVGTGVGTGVGSGAGGAGGTEHCGSVQVLVLVSAGHTSPPFIGGVTTFLDEVCSPTRSGTGFSVNGKSHALAAATRAYTPGAFGRAHPAPQETIPTSLSEPSSRIKGPPLSPWHES